MRKKVLWGRPVLASFMLVGVFAACGGGDDKKGGDGDSSGDGDGDGDGDINLGGATGDGDGDGDGDKSCGGEEVEAEPLAANILIVLDTSASMLDTPGGFSANKWDTVVASLKVALPEVESLLHLGMKVFPSGDTGENVCALTAGIDVEVQSGEDSVPSITSVLDGTTPAGDTPTAAALAEALDYFENGAGKDLEGAKYVLLATDGGPNCGSAQVDCTCDGQPHEDASCGIPTRCTLNIDNTAKGETVCGEGWGSCCLPDQIELCLDDNNTASAVEALASAGIRTIVLGIPGSEAYGGVLDALAEAGGLPAATTSPKYHKVDDPDGLTATLRAVTQGLIRSCEVLLKETPQNYGKVNVYLDGEVIPKNDDDGWRYDESTNPYTIVLTGPTCTDVEAQGIENIKVEFGCDTQVVR